MIKRHIEENKNDKQLVELAQEMFKPQYNKLTKLPSPRFIKSHLPLSLLPPSLLDTCKVVYVARDPRDAVVSFYHLNRQFKVRGYIGDFKTYWNYFIKGLSKYISMVICLFNFCFRILQKVIYIIKAFVFMSNTKFSQSRLIQQLKVRCKKKLNL